MRNTKKIQLIFLMSSLFYGGAETQMRKIVTALNNDERIETTVLIERRWRNNYKDEDSFIENNRNIKFIDMNIVTENQYTRLIKTYAFLIPYFRNNKPEILLSYTLNGLLTLPLCHLNGVKLVYSERNSGETITAKKLYVYMLRKADVLSCNSKSAWNYMTKATKKTIHLINNGIDLPSDILQVKNTAICKLLIPARIHHDKNQKYIIECINKKMNIELYFAGKIDDEGYYNELVQLSKEKEIEEKCHWLGYLKNIDTEYDKYDVVVLPSIAEGTPNVVLEAFAKGMPVIASNIEMTSPLYGDEQLMFSLDDYNGLIKCLDYLDGMSLEKRKEMLKRNREFVETNYSTSAMTKKYIEIIINLE